MVLRSFAVLGLVLTFGTAGAFAAVVSWSGKIDASTNLPVNNGNVIEAVNSGGEEVVINGITFKDGDFGDEITNSNLLDAFESCCSDNGAPTGADEDMAVMLDSHRWKSTSGQPSVATLRLEGLTVGNDYQIQLYYSDFRPGSYKTYFWLGDGSASETFVRGTTEDNWSFIGTFTADADEQNIHLVPDGQRLDGFDNHDPGLSGYVLSLIPAATVPEPSSLVLAGFALLGGLALRRRRGAQGAAALMVVLMVGVSGASAASISWSDPIDASTNLPVNNGMVIEAVNSGGEEVVINGITFKDGDFGDEITNSNLLDAFESCCSDNGAPTGADEDMAVMLDSHRWKSTSGQATVATLVLEGLEAGTNYQIQLYYSDFRPGSYKEYYWAGDNASLSDKFIRGTTVDNWSFIGTFTADSDEQRVLLIPNGTRLDGFVNHDPGLSGYVLSLSDKVGSLRGDFDGNFVLDADDINALTQASAGGGNPAEYDLTGDGLVNADDVKEWIRADDIFYSWVGDADLNKKFESDDLIGVLAEKTYENGSPAEWTSGDFDGDGLFKSDDLISALADNGYEKGERTDVASVPEPASFVLALLGLAACAQLRRNRR